MNSSKENFLSFILPLVILVVLVFGFKWSVLDANNIPSGSMIPTLKIGDYLFVNKMRYSFRIPYTDIELFRYDDPQRGDIITFIPPANVDSGKHYVKRVMAMPGDMVRIRNIPACSIKMMLRYSQDNEIKPDDIIKNVAAENSESHDYECGSYYSSGRYGEPIVAIVEYREKGVGPWRHYKLREYDSEQAQKLLSDADNIKVIHPDLIPPELRQDHLLPVVFEEVVGDRTHLLVETSFSAEPYPEKICPEISTTGCLIPEDYYLAMGDNRDDSKDSRYIGLIPRGSILGKALVIYFSINWRDQICEHYVKDFQDARGAERGYSLEDFPPEDQYRYCSRMDAMAGYEGLVSYLKRTILYRIPRLDVRWGRIARILE